MTKAISERPMPYSSDAERAILAAGLLDKKAVLEAANYVTREDFYLYQNRLIFAASQALVAEGKPVDMVSLLDFLGRQGKLEDAGGGPYIASLSEGVAKIGNLPHHARIVKEHTRRRAVITACATLEEAAFEGKEDAGKLLQDGAGAFLSLMSQDGTASMPSTWEESINSAMNEVVEAIRFPGSVMRWKFGIQKIDDLTGGWRRQDLNLLVGMTSHGKSLLAMQGAINADNAGYKGLVFSAEMSKEALAKRELAHTANLPLYLLRRPEIIRHPDSVISDLTSAALKERTRRILVVDRDVRPARVWSMCELTHRSTGLDYVIVDYDQLVIRAGLKMRDDEFRAQAEFMAEALALCKRLNICFVLLCQPRKVDEDVARGRRPPRVEQIFGSSSVANTAHNILWVMREYFLHGMEPEYKQLALAYVLKARNDKTGAEKIGFDEHSVLFTNERMEASPAPGRERADRKKKAKDEREET
jgi:replicative DNA helicase